MVGCEPATNRQIAMAATKTMCHQTDRSFMNETIRVPATLNSDLDQDQRRR